MEKNAKNKNNSVPFVLASVCFLIWPVIFITPFLFLTPILVLVVLTILTSWKRDIFPTKQHLLAGSILGALFQALVLEQFYLKSHSLAPLRGDDDGLWGLILPILIFWWVVAKIIGLILYKIAISKK